MSGAANPWIPPQPHGEKPPPAILPPMAATGPTRPQRGVSAPDWIDQLPIRPADHPATLWVVGAHGGAGESAIAALDRSWSAASHAWPTGSMGTPAVVVVARTSFRGLTAAKSAAKQWAAGLVGRPHLLGLVLVADAPGRLPRPLRDLAKVVAGGYPRVWNVPWIESWRLGEEVTPDSAPREVRRLVDDLRTLLHNGAPGTTNERSR